jgi:hypothetical protein
MNKKSIRAFWKTFLEASGVITDIYDSRYINFRIQDSRGNIHYLSADRMTVNLGKEVVQFFEKNILVGVFFNPISVKTDASL